MKERLYLCISRVKIQLASILALTFLIHATAFADGQYFVRHGRNSENMGPYTESELRTRLRNGVIKPIDYVWSKSLVEWTQISKSPFVASRARIPASDQSPPPFLGGEKKEESSPPENQAQTDPSSNISRESYIGALLGAAVSTSAGGANTFTFAFRGGTTLLATPQIGLLSAGLIVGNTSNTVNVGTVSASGSNTTIAAEIIARRTLDTGLYFGGRFGLALESVTLSVASSGLSYSASSIAFAVGPVVGYELPVSPAFAVNLDISWLTVTGTTLTFPSLGSIQANASSAFLFMGGAVFHW